MDYELTKSTTSARNSTELFEGAGCFIWPLVMLGVYALIWVCL